MGRWRSQPGFIVLYSCRTRMRGDRDWRRGESVQADRHRKLQHHRRYYLAKSVVEVKEGTRARGYYDYDYIGPYM